MNNIVKFTLSGYGATFTKPYFNSYQATYNHIHKVAILGLLGAIIGLDKTNLLFNKKNEYTLPKFYEELKSIKVAIVPSEPLFFKSKPTITETTGFFNDKETFLAEIEELINPSWDIYLLNDGSCKHFEKIKEMLLKGYSVYDLYLGKNHHFANISNVTIESATIENLSDFNKIDSLFPLDDIVLLESDDDDEDECEMDYEYTVREFMPVGFIPLNHQYEEKMMCYTNKSISSNSNVEIFNVGDRLVWFI